MYDRSTNTIWKQFTGEPVIGPLADSGMRLTFFPVTLTTWADWLAEHPDTTVISLDTGLYPAGRYEPESDPRSVYFDYFNSAETMFPVWERSAVLQTKDVVLGLELGGMFRAYPMGALQRERVVNDELGGTDVVVIGSSSSQAARAYERDGRLFTLGKDDVAYDALPTMLLDSNGSAWVVTEEFLIDRGDPSHKLRRIPTHTSFWFGWFAFHPDTQVYTSEGN